MCFSAPASFVGSAVIGGIGAVSQNKVIRPNQRLFALIPLIFAIQQLAEGALWITLASGSYQTLEMVATYVFIVPALILWPFIVPLSLLLMEERKPGKQYFAACWRLGVALFFLHIA